MPSWADLLVEIDAYGMPWKKRSRLLRTEPGVLTLYAVSAEGAAESDQKLRDVHEDEASTRVAIYKRHTSKERQKLRLKAW